MATTTQYNPNVDLNAKLGDIGLSKTVYALVTPLVETAKAELFGDEDSPQRRAYLDHFTEAWTGKQDQSHEDFFSTWCEWAAPVVNFDQKLFPYYYPTAGASEAIRQVLFDLAVAGHRAPRVVHVLDGDYEGYRAMAEAANLNVCTHIRPKLGETFYDLPMTFRTGDLFFISQPSAIDGNVWKGFNDFLRMMPDNSVVVDATYVGAIPSVDERFDLTLPSVKNVIFSLSKPFGCYYDRIGGIFCRDENPALFGNRWFKNLTSLQLGINLMRRHQVFDLANEYADAQRYACGKASILLGHVFEPSDVFILATAERDAESNDPMVKYLSRGGRLRVCLTPTMAQMIGQFPR